LARETHPDLAAKNGVLTKKINSLGPNRLNFRSARVMAETLLFKDEPMPRIVGIGVFTDSHYTRVPLTGWYGNIVLQESGKE